MTTARYGGRLSALRTDRLYPQEYSWYSFSLRAESTPGPWFGQGNMSLKNPVTTPGIDPGTVRLVAQRLNHYATPGPIGLFTSGKESRYPLDTMLGGLHSRSESFGGQKNLLALPGLEPRTVQPVTWSLYRLCHPSSARWRMACYSCKH